jgi:hypothetical protein
MTRLFFVEKSLLLFNRIINNKSLRCATKSQTSSKSIILNIVTPFMIFFHWVFTKLNTLPGALVKGV